MLLRKEIKEVIESRENSGNGMLYERWNDLKHFHAVTYVWSVLGETAWRMVSSDLSRRGFRGWFMEILVLNKEVLGSGTCPPLEPTS